jgi:cytochrome c
MYFSLFQRKVWVAAIVLVALCMSLLAFQKSNETIKVLVFSKTTGYRHASIPQGIAAIKKLGKLHNFIVDTTENAANFTEDNLKQYKAVIFLSTTGNVLNVAQQADFERYIQAGGGYVGIHAATDTEYGWPWYNKLVGAYFKSHPGNPNVQKGVLQVVDKNHPATDSFPNPYSHTDEFYDFKSMNPDIKVLVKVDESSYKDGKMGDNHPMAWYHEYDGGRAFYTNFGHTDAAFSDPVIVRHLWGGIKYAINGKALNYSAAKTIRVPEENRFETENLAGNLDEPIAMEVMNDGRVLMIERKGGIKLYEPKSKEVKNILTLPVFWHKYNSGRSSEDGLLGVALDPNFDKNNYVYFYYSPAIAEPKNILARFVLKGEQLDTTSKKVIIEVPVQRDECCHTGGSIAFDNKGNLFLSTGDNTNPFNTKESKYNSLGYGPTDERPNRSAWDAQRSSGNTNDLRGKIIRIKVNEDGTYSIPEGNLFAKGTAKTRPEIYVMGNRNPYKISVDQKNGFLYWGEVGPDARLDSATRGPRGHDEVNQARKAGFFGWPLFVADNKPYYRFNYETGESAFLHDPMKPVNLSPNNTGLKELPPAQKAFIWYPYADSKEFPEVNKGGSSRNAMAGPVFYKDMYTKSTHTFPDYYDGKLFVYDWMRGWILVATMDKEGNLLQLEDFMPSVKYGNPIDMKFAADGSMYILQYGSPTWFGKNENASLLHITYNAGNRKPLVKVEANKKAGATPLTVKFSSVGTKDFDRDKLKYAWTFTGKTVQSTQANPSFTFAKPGMYTASLTVTDEKGASNTAEVEILAGNEKPSVAVTIPGGNKTFFWDNRKLNYEVKVTDKEDGSLAAKTIKPEDVAVTIEYMPDGYKKPVQEGQDHETIMNLNQFGLGKRLIDQSDCRACHSNDKKSIGPPYMEVAQKYKGQGEAMGILASKIIKGGGGIWGEQVMPAHPQLSQKDANEMVKYIMSLADTDQKTPSQPAKGTYTTAEHLNKPGKGNGAYVIRAVYTDKGANGISPLAAQDVLVLRSSLVPAASANGPKDITKYSLPDDSEVVIANHGGQIYFKGIDFTGVGSLTFYAGADPQYTKGGKLEVHLDSPKGPLAGAVTVQNAPAMQQLKVPLKGVTGKHDVYFTFVNPEVVGQPLFGLAAIQFQVSTTASSASK